MTHARTIGIIGLFLVLMPILGLPIRWKMTVVVLVGIYLIYIGYKEYRKNEKERLKKEEKTQTYTENSINENSIE